MPDVIVEVTEYAHLDEVVEVIEVIEILIPGPPGPKGDPGDPGEPAALGGSLRSVGGKAEAGGARQTITNYGDIDLAVSNRWLMIPEDSVSSFRIFNPPPDATFSVILGYGGSALEDPIELRIWPSQTLQTIVWPENTPPDPATFPAAAGQYLPLAFDRIGENTWLGYYGKVHRSA